MIDIAATAEFILEAFEALGARPLLDGALDARRIPGRSGNYVAVSASRELFVLLEVDSEIVVEERRLSALHVLTGEDFTIVDASVGETIRHRFAMVTLRAGHDDLVASFAVVAATLLATLPDAPTSGEIVEFLDNFVELTAPRRTAAMTTVVGLWGELWLIASAESPTDFASAWHSGVGDRFDFSFSASRLELKTTSGQSRTHDFGLGQLTSDDAKPTWIASLAVLADPSGQTVVDVLDALLPALPGSLAARVSRIALRTLSGDIESAQDFGFAPIGAEPLMVYASTDVPRPSIGPGSAISNVRFRATLDDVEPVARSIEQLSRLIRSGRLEH